MAIITLTTDWEKDDYYISAIKGRILGLAIDVQVVDITHKITSFSTTQAAFVLRNSYKNFPEGTVHIIGVLSENNPETPHLAVKINGHFFIGADTGVFGLIDDSTPEAAILLEQPYNGPFPELDIFANASVHLALGKDILELGIKTTAIKQPMPLQPAMEQSVITGSIVYIDSYSNVITNISQDDFEKVGKNRLFDILVHSNHYKINAINKKYNETPQNKLLALFNSAKLLEIAINGARAAELLNLHINDSIRIVFHDKKEKENLKLH